MKTIKKYTEMAKQNTEKTPPMYSEDFKLEETVNASTEVNDKDLEIPLYETEEVPENEVLETEKKNILQKYSAADAVIAKLEARLNLVTVDNESTYKTVYDTHQLIKKWYRFVEGVRKKGKEPLLEMGRTYDTEAKRIEQLLDKVDNKCLELRKPWEDKKEADRLEKIKKEQETLNSRISSIQSFGMVLNGSSWVFKDITIDANDLRTMQENVWNLVLKQIEEEFTKDQAEKEAQAELLRKEEEEKQKELNDLREKTEKLEQEKRDRERKQEEEERAKADAQKALDAERRKMDEERLGLRLERLNIIGLEYDNKLNACTYNGVAVEGMDKESILAATSEEFFTFMDIAKELVKKATDEADKRKQEEEQELAAQQKLEAEEKAQREQQNERKKFLELIGCEIDESKNWVYNTKLEKKDLVCLPLYVSSEDLLIYSVDEFNDLISKITIKIENYEKGVADDIKKYELELEEKNKANAEDRQAINKYFNEAIDYINLYKPSIIDFNLSEKLDLEIKSVTDTLLFLAKKYKD